MMPLRLIAHTRGWGPASLLASLFLVATSTGCADWSYRAIEIGQNPRDYDNVLPRGLSRQTELGLCYFEAKDSGRSDAVVVNLGADRRVDGKWHATQIKRLVWRQPKTGYHLHGEFAPGRVGLGQAGPVDVLRLNLLALTERQVDPHVVRAHTLVAAGIARLIESSPDTSLADVCPDAEDLLALTSADGQAQLERDEAGVYHFEYHEGIER